MRPDDEPARLAMNSSTPPDHLPGLHCETLLPRGDLQAAQGCPEQTCRQHRGAAQEVQKWLQCVLAEYIHLLRLRLLLGLPLPTRLHCNSEAHCTSAFPGPHHTGYHPHYHGSSMLQTSTANGLIIVEGESKGLRVCQLPATPALLLAAPHDLHSMSWSALTVRPASQ